MTDTKARDTGIAIGLMMLAPALAVKPMFDAFNMFWGVPTKDRTPRADTRERVPSKFDGR